MNTNLEILRQIQTMSGHIGKIDGLVTCQNEMKKSIDAIKDDFAGIKEGQAILRNEIKHIIDDNLEFKNGMDKKIETLKTDYEITKSTVQKHGIWFTIIHFITVSVVGWLGLK